MDTDTQRLIKQILSNDEASSDEELVALFTKEGSHSEAEAKEWVAKRGFYANNIVMQDEGGNDIGVYDPATRSSTRYGATSAHSSSETSEGYSLRTVIMPANWEHRPVQSITGSKN